MEKTVRLAITGGIGSGKSVVSHIMQIMGVPVYDCDRRAKELMHSSATLVREIKRMFGEESYTDEGVLDRNFIASRIFTDSGNIERMNALVHPAVIEDFKQWAEAQNKPLVAVESAVLYESGLIEQVDKVLLVWADKETAIERTVKRSGLSRAQVLNRMDNQMTSDELLLLSDYSIYNDKETPLLPQVVEILSELRG